MICEEKGKSLPPAEHLLDIYDIICHSRPGRYECIDMINIGERTKFRDMSMEEYNNRVAKRNYPLSSPHANQRIFVYLGITCDQVHENFEGIHATIFSGGFVIIYTNQITTSISSMFDISKAVIAPPAPSRNLPFWMWPQGNPFGFNKDDNFNRKQMKKLRAKSSLQRMTLVIFESNDKSVGVIHYPTIPQILSSSPLLAVFAQKNLFIAKLVETMKNLKK